MSFAVEALVVVAEPFISALHFHRKDDDRLDWLNHKVANCIMFLMVFIHTFYQIFLDKVIHCWAPAEFPDSWIDYTNAYCWIKDTHYLKQSDHKIVTNYENAVVYYQWVPYILSVLGLLAYFPGLLWYVGVDSCGVDIQCMIYYARNIMDPLTRTVSTPPKYKQVRYMARHVHKTLYLSHSKYDSHCVAKNKFSTARKLSLPVLRISTNVLYFVSNLLQIYFMHQVMGERFIFYGVNVMKEIFLGMPGSAEAELFPLVTVCDFSVRSKAKPIPVTVQCHLPINIFNAKIFLIVWFWLAALTIINICGLIAVTVQLLPYYRKSFLESLLKPAGVSVDVRSTTFRRFAEEYIGCDGYIMLKLISRNGNLLVATEVTKLLWEQFKYQNDDLNYPKNILLEEPNTSLDPALDENLRETHSSSTN